MHWWRVAVLTLIMTGCAHGVTDDDRQDSHTDGRIEATDRAVEAHDEAHVSADGGYTGELPAPQARLMYEGEACDAIVDTYHGHGLDLGCATTTHVCPDMFYFTFGVQCMQYEGDSIRDCVRTIEQATTCDELYATQCNVRPAWGSEPLGCQQPIE